MTTRQSLEQTVCNKAICMLYENENPSVTCLSGPQSDFQFYILSIQASPCNLFLAERGREIIMISFVIISL